MNAIALKILVESYYKTVVFDPNTYSPAEREAIYFLVTNQLIQRQDSQDPHMLEYDIHPRGEIFVKHVLALPLPKGSWTMIHLQTWC